MIFTALPLAGAYRIDLETREDERGFFARLFCDREFAAHGLETRWVQMNNSQSRARHTLRGLHFQRPPQAEVKVVRCLHGAIWDVLVDLRAGSPTFGQWAGAELSADNRAMLYVPRGFAHGFLSLSDEAEILYLVSAHYSPAHEGALRWDDPQVAIAWPATPTAISDKDARAPLLRELAPLELGAAP